MTPTRKRYAKALARSNNIAKSMAANVLKDPAARYWLVQGLGKVILYELKLLCSNRVQSVQRAKDEKSISHFPWDEMIKEMTDHCPMLVNLLLVSTETRPAKSNQKYIICAIICMLCKFRCRSMALFQKLISMLLYAGHVGTKVCITCIAGMHTLISLLDFRSATKVYDVCW